MSGKPIDEAVRQLTMIRDGYAAGPIVQAEKVSALDTAIETLAAAQQQGQAVACVCCEDKPAPGNNPCACCGRTAPPPSVPVGAEYAKQLAVALWRHHYRDDAPQWEPFDDLPGLLSQIDNMVSGLTRAPAPAQQPAAVDEAMVERFCRRWYEITGRSLERAYVLASLDSALAAQHQEPTAMEQT